jgi:hypothetical protein
MKTRLVAILAAAGLLLNSCATATALAASPQARQPSNQLRRPAQPRALAPSRASPFGQAKPVPRAVTQWRSLLGGSMGSAAELIYVVSLAVRAQSRPVSGSVSGQGNSKQNLVW